jgi:hypothetical protein
VAFKIESDTISIGFDKMLGEKDESCPKYPKKNTIRIYSDAFFRAEQKREHQAKGIPSKSKSPELIENIGGFKLKVDF